MKFRVLARLGLTLACLGAMSGCHDKSKECEQLVAAMNEQGDAIRTATKKMGDAKEDITAIKNVAGAMDNAARAVRKVKLEDKKLGEFAGQYEKLMKNGADAARRLADAAQRGDAEGTKKANERIREAQKTEASLVKEINSYCSP